MVEILSTKSMNNKKQIKIRTGKQILDILTIGMYSNPLMVLREYVQNAVDSLDEAVIKGLLIASQCRVDIHIDPDNRSISILDNGVGIEKNMVAQLLCSLGISSKENYIFRGFRGIGRLGGLGYCDEVIFETKSNKSPIITKVIWDAKKLHQLCKLKDQNLDAISIIRSSIHVNERKCCEIDSHHFFKVTLKNIVRFHSDELLNINGVKSYLEKTAPVPYDKENFPFSDFITGYLKKIDGYRSYNIYVNGRKLFRPHSKNIIINGKIVDEIKGIDVFEIKRDKCILGRGWYAKTGFLGSLPQQVGMRGVRIRQGNIEIGDEYFIADSFTERRFSTWNIGEIHLNYSVITNSRRDGFEQSPNMEIFLEKTRSLGKHLSFLCRNASIIRTNEAKRINKVIKAESLLKKKFYINEKHFDDTHCEIQTILESIDKIASNNKSPRIDRRIKRIRIKLAKSNGNIPYLRNILDGRILRYMSQKEVIEKIAENLMVEFKKNGLSDNMMTSILVPFINEKFK